MNAAVSEYQGEPVKNNNNNERMVKNIQIQMYFI